MKTRIILKSFNKTLIETIIINLTKIFLKYFIKASIISLPIKIKKFCVLRSPHIDKDSREQFELCSYKKLIDIDNKYFNNSKFINELVHLNVINGIECEIKII